VVMRKHVQFNIPFCAIVGGICYLSLGIALPIDKNITVSPSGMQVPIRVVPINNKPVANGPEAVRIRYLIRRNPPYVPTV
jgi:hypothetical protein